MESCSTQAVLPLVGLTADNVIRAPYTQWWIAWSFPTRKSHKYRGPFPVRNNAAMNNGAARIRVCPWLGSRFPGDRR
ncbi:MAG: hypothetical protein ACQESR_23810 [Planctomycetota bacterium]